MLEKIARHWGLMNAMAQKAGVDLGYEYIHGRLTRAHIRGAVFTCTQCSHVADCEAFLAGEREPADRIPDFCINKPTISALRATRH